MSTSGRRINVRIDRLVLHGLDRAAGQAIAASLGAALAEGVARPGGIAELREHDGDARLDAGSTPLRQPDLGTRIGRQIVERLT